MKRNVSILFFLYKYIKNNRWYLNEMTEVLSLHNCKKRILLGKKNPLQRSEVLYELNFRNELGQPSRNIQILGQNFHLTLCWWLTYSSFTLSQKMFAEELSYLTGM